MEAPWLRRANGIDHIDFEQLADLSSELELPVEPARVALMREAPPPQASTAARFCW